MPCFRALSPSELAHTLSVECERESCSVVSDSLWPHGLVHGILQAIILEWVAFPFSRGSSQPRDWTQVSHIAVGFFTSWATREAQRNPLLVSCCLVAQLLSDSLQPCGLQHARLPHPSPSPGVCSDSCPLSQWCHPTPPYPLSLPSLSSLNLSQHQDLFQWIDFPSGGQSTGASAFVLTMNIQGWFPIGLTGLILLSKGLSRVFSSTTFQNHQFFSAQPSLWSQLSSRNKKKVK